MIPTWLLSLLLAPVFLGLLVLCAKVELARNIMMGLFAFAFAWAIMAMLVDLTRSTFE